MKRWACTAALLLALGAGPAGAYTCEGNQCTLYLTIIESTGTNLKEHVFTYQKVGGPAQTLTIPATKPTGGGTVTVKTAPQMVPPCTTATFTGSIVTRTTTGQTSSPDVAAPPTIDRTKLANGMADPACKR